MKLFLVISVCFLNFTLARTALSLVSPPVNQMKIDHPIQTEIELNGSFLKVSFDVSTESINAKPTLQTNEYPYQFDVVELFLTVNASSFPYYEFEVSPYDQTFVVRIDKPKKFVNSVKIEWTHSTQLTPHGWRAMMTIDLSKLNWDGDVAKIKGNLYAIIGKIPNRHYWSLSLPKMKKANFHLPQYFQPLVKQ